MSIAMDFLRHLRWNSRKLARIMGYCKYLRMIMLQCKSDEICHSTAKIPNKIPQKHRIKFIIIRFSVVYNFIIQEVILCNHTPVIYLPLPRKKPC